MERSEDCRGARQIAFGLCDRRLCRQDIDIVRSDIENLVKFPQRFRETTKKQIGKRMLIEKGNAARVEPLGFVKVRLAMVPLPSPPRDVSQRLRNTAVIGQEPTCLLKVTHRGV